MSHAMLESFLDWYNAINKNKFSNKYSPHKPLTILLALAKVLRGERWIDYNQDREMLETFIWDHTNMKTSPNCLQPMWRLKNDSKKIPVWDTLPSSPELNASGDIPTGYAKENQFKVGFSDSFFTWLSNNKPAVQYLIEYIIDDNFSETLTEDILTTLGVDDLTPQLVTNEVIEQTVKKAKRDPNFPKTVLSHYDNQCCFCRLKINFNNKPLNMEAAHIKWKARGGDCSIENGLSLCPTHHLTFDRGVWTLDENYEIVISESALINTQHDIFFTAFRGKSIADSIMDKSFLPNQDNLEWHRKSIFK